MADPISPDKGDIAYGVAMTGFAIHNEEHKADGIRDKDGKQAVFSDKQPDGLFVVSGKLPNGEMAYWHQTDLMMDGTRGPDQPLATGIKVMAYERRMGPKPSDPPYVGADGRPQAIIWSVGTLNTEEDLVAFRKAAHGDNPQAMFDVTGNYTREWADNAQKRSAANGLPMPDVVIGSQLEGSYTAPAITYQLHELGLQPPKLTVEYASLGAGAGLRHVAETKAAKDSAGNPMRGDLDRIGNMLAQNVISPSAEQHTVYDVSGGGWAHANARVGETYSYEGSHAWYNFGGMLDDKLVLPANDLNKKGYAALTRTPQNDTPLSTILHDTRISAQAQQDAEKRVGIYDTLIRGTRAIPFLGDGWSDEHTVPTDLHEQVVVGRTPRSFSELKRVPTETQQAAAPSPSRVVVGEPSPSKADKASIPPVAIHKPPVRVPLQQP